MLRIFGPAEERASEIESLFPRPREDPHGPGSLRRCGPLHGKKTTGEGCVETVDRHQELFGDDLAEGGTSVINRRVTVRVQKAMLTWDFIQKRL
jgi:hypothetical protein